MKIAVIGAGSWGSAIAWLLGNNGHAVRLWARSPELASAINSEHRNPRYISNVPLPASLVATASLSDALDAAEAVVLATPSAAVRTTAQAMADKLGRGRTGNSLPLLLLAKGLEICEYPKPPLLLLDVLAAELGAPERLAVLSGPNHAEEVALRMPAGSVVAARESGVAELFQQVLATPSFRVYSSDDCVGVQLCGAGKNVIAIAAGVAAGLKLGDNLAAMLMTRGLAEISRLVAASGGQPQTCMGLAGMGDLIVTCSSRHSRNRAFGLALAKGATLTKYEADTHMVVEGARACRALPALAATLSVEMPISEHVRGVVWEGRPLDKTLASLLDRPTKPEFC
jgi:glycerol-3-phosphate dehydrogenase (NAD(P)+)